MYKRLIGLSSRPQDAVWIFGHIIFLEEELPVGWRRSRLSRPRFDREFGGRRVGDDYRSPRREDLLSARHSCCEGSICRASARIQTVSWRG